jgi:hypothetical protein
MTHKSNKGIERQWFQSYLAVSVMSDQANLKDAKHLLFFHIT